MGTSGLTDRLLRNSGLLSRSNLSSDLLGSNLLSCWGGGLLDRSLRAKERSAIETKIRRAMTYLLSRSFGSSSFLHWCLLGSRSGLLGGRSGLLDGRSGFLSSSLVRGVNVNIDTSAQGSK